MSRDELLNVSTILLLTSIGLLMLFLIAGTIWHAFLRGDPLERNGEPALFKIIGATEDIGFNTSDGRPQITFDLVVHPLLGDIYRAKKSASVPFLQIQRVQAGSWLPGKFDPHNRSQMQLDFRDLTADEQALTQAYAQWASDALPLTVIRRTPTVEDHIFARTFIALLGLIGLSVVFLITASIFAR